ncbi:inner membrane protein [Xylella phage Xfas53]|uniref:inner membrane protein n=1 Tax=Xylella phage Xfas53 TaxID=670252 RepID=UPI0001B60FF2|nr:inner membrane protein [Xylella phage Xfas53]ACV41141.1 inner membrane protein [Xylella phage Xfas53]
MASLVGVLAALLAERLGILNTTLYIYLGFVALAGLCVLFVYVSMLCDEVVKRLGVFIHWITPSWLARVLRTRKANDTVNKPVAP